jgi:hypothetical protein
MVRQKFKKNIVYYLRGENLKLKYNGLCELGYHCFKIITKGCQYSEFETKDPDWDIMTDRKEWETTWKK